MICAGGGGIPTAYTDEPAPAGRRLRGVEAVIDKDLASALLAIEIGADALLIVTDVDAVYADWGTPEQRAIRNATPDELAGAEFAAGSMGPKVRAACWFAERTGGFAAIGSIADTQALLRGRGRHARRASRPPSTRAERGPRWRPPHRAADRPTTEGADLARALARGRGCRSWTSSRSAGLTSEEAAERLARYGPNKFAEAKTEPRWHAFLRQYQDPMQIVLLVAGVISIYPVKQPGTGIVILLLTLLNAVLGPQPGGQGGGGRGGAGEDDDRQGARAPRRRARAAAGRAARARATSSRSRPATSCPADGRVLAAATLEVAEAALTGESLPVGKGVEPVDGARRAARRPHRHGLHEHQRHARDRASSSSPSTGHGDRGRPHLRDAAAPGRVEVAADACSWRS